MILIKQCSISSDAIHTALFVRKMDKLFDLLNSSFFGRPGRSPILASQIQDFLEKTQEYISWISSWSFVSVEGNKTRSSMPFQKGWIMTLTNYQQVVQQCFSAGIPRLCTRRLNQDFLEVCVTFS